MRPATDPAPHAGAVACGQQHAHMAGKLDELGEGTSKHSSAWPHAGCGAATTELAGKDSEAQGKGGFDPARSNKSQQMGRLGQADNQLLQLSRQMARIFLEFPVRWPAGPQRTLIHRWQLGYPGGVAGVQGPQTHRERAGGQRRPSQRREAGSSLHASFNSGISSVYSSDVRDKRLCMSLFSESVASLCTGRLLPEPATQEEVVA